MKDRTRGIHEFRMEVPEITEDLGLGVIELGVIEEVDRRQRDERKGRTVAPGPAPGARTTSTIGNSATILGSARALMGSCRTPLAGSPFVRSRPANQGDICHPIHEH